MDGHKMTTPEMLEIYNVEGFAYGVVIVRRKSDGAIGTLDFDHAPRLYYGFVQEAVN